MSLKILRTSKVNFQTIQKIHEKEYRYFFVGLNCIWQLQLPFFRNITNLKINRHKFIFLNISYIILKFDCVFVSPNLK